MIKSFLFLSAFHMYSKTMVLTSYEVILVLNRTVDYEEGGENMLA